jgi:mannose/fructose/N-acetylgalactosamine-specific phosphotransferase system component IIC
MNRIAFPISIAANTFTAGVYSFRLTVQRLGNTNINRQTFSEVILSVNSVPGGGSVSSDPTTGTALETPFAVSTSGWAAAAENYPLSYAFAYQVTTASMLTMATVSPRAFVTAALPAGKAIHNHLITLQGRAVDIFLSSGVATAPVTVRASLSTNITQLLALNVASGFTSGDVDLVFQTINNVATTVNSVNCIGAPPPLLSEDR